ncbi:Fic family protein [Saccharothrix saharensis]|uniref:Fic family protein n=1 Tax=Saccharothrix saharensis TaxID=571190 RepID=UPI0036CD7823
MRTGSRDLPSYFPSAPPDVIPFRDETVAALCLAENAAGALRQATPRVPDVDAFVTSLRMREVLRSARQTRYTAMPTETWLAALWLSSPHTGGEDLEEVVRRRPVGRYVRAADLLAAELARGRHTGIEALNAVSAVLTGQPVGSVEEGLRQVDDVLTAGAGGAPYVRVAPPGETLVRAVWEWDRWVARPYAGPRLAKIAVAYLLLVLQRPYPKANGYLAGLFVGNELVRHGVVDHPVLLPAPWLDDHAEEYRARVRAAVEGGPLWEWVEFFARGVREQATSNLALIDALDDLRAELVERTDGSRSVRKVLAALPTSPVTSINALALRHGTSRKTSAQITRRLVADGVLRVVAEHPVKVFACEEAMDLLVFDHAPPRTDRRALDPVPDHDRTPRSAQEE